MVGERGKVRKRWWREGGTEGERGVKEKRRRKRRKKRKKNKKSWSILNVGSCLSLTQEHAGVNLLGLEF